MTEIYPEGAGLNREGKLSKMLYYLEAAREIERTLAETDRLELRGRGFHGRTKQIERWLEADEVDAGA